MDDKKLDPHEALKRADESMKDPFKLSDVADYRWYYDIYRVYYKPPKNQIQPTQIEETFILCPKSISASGPYLLGKARNQLNEKIKKKHEQEPLFISIQIFNEDPFTDKNEAQEYASKLDEEERKKHKLS
jgi:hypothetical protein